MKIKLEIDTNVLDDVSQAIKILNPLASNDCVVSDESVSIEDRGIDCSCLEEIQDEIDYSCLEEVEEDVSQIAEDDSLELLNKELLECKEKCKSLSDEKMVLIKERDELLTIVESKSEDTPSADLDEIEKIKSECESLKKTNEKLEKDVSFHEGRSNKNFEEVKRLRVIVDKTSNERDSIKRELNNISKKMEDMSNVEPFEGVSKEEFEEMKKKLKADVEFHENRSNRNFEEVKTLRIKIKELSDNSESLDKEKVDELKSEMRQMKMDFEKSINELKLLNDKLENENAMFKDKCSEDDLEELEYLRKIKKAICSQAKGADFWANVELTLKMS